jgi:hypothetical protein
MFFSEAEGIFVSPGLGKGRNLGEIRPRHAHHLGVRPPRADLHPVVVHQLDRDVAVAEQLDVVVELARGNRAGARLLHLGRARSLDALVEVRRGDRQPVVGRLDQKIRQDRNRGLALDHALRCGQLAQQLGAADGDLHGSADHRRLLLLHL